MCDEPTLVVMAAGIGSRYGGLKQVDPVGPSGEMIIDYAVYDALRAGFGRVVFVITEEIEAVFRERVGRRIEARCETAYAFQRLDDVPPGCGIPAGRQKPWGTAHATYTARRAVDGPFVVINADDFYGRTSFQVLGDYLRGARDRGGVYDYCMVGFVLRNTLTDHGYVSRGICTVDEDSFLVDVRERVRIERVGQDARYSEDEGATWAALPGNSVTSMNMWGFTPSLFAELEAGFVAFQKGHRQELLKAEYFLPDLVGGLAQVGKATVRVLPTEERWFGMTYLEDRAAAKQAIQELIDCGVYPEKLWDGVG